MKDDETLQPEENLACPVLTYQEAEVCLPVTIKPFAKTGPIRARCKGSAVIRPGIKNCVGVKDGECSFTVTQKLSIHVPVIFGARALVGDTYVCCLKPCGNLDKDQEDRDCDERSE